MDYVEAKLLKDERMSTVKANRSGGKSAVGIGFVRLVKALMHEKFNCKILAGSEEQAYQSYSAINDYAQKAQLTPTYINDLLATIARFHNGSRISILSASTKSARGHHPQDLCIDEADEVPYNIFQAALSQPQSKHGITASLDILSTHHNVGGVMEMVLSQPDKFGHKYIWCIWETMVSCKDRSCSQCKLSPICKPTKEKKALRDACAGYYSVEDFYVKLNTMSDDTLNAEWLCIAPQRRTVVFTDYFFPDMHVNADVKFNPNYPVELGVDFGTTNPFSVVAFQRYDGMKFAIDELYETGLTTREMVELIQKRDWAKNIIASFCDNAEPDRIKEMNQLGLNAVGVKKKKLTDSLEDVKTAFYPASHKVTTLLSPKCRGLIWECTDGYRYPEKNGLITSEVPIDENNHSISAMRYWLAGTLTENFKSSFWEE